ncbi:MAG: glycosyltransferase family 4 protein [Deltaproteobacteria bacterium]|nr:glycosyltransferase family 4 protein [Deltaproteobacteria bacterium]
MRKLRIFTWHVHGSYLYYLAQCGHTIYLPVKPNNQPGYGGRCGERRWPPNLVDVPAKSCRDLKFDILLYQSTRNYLTDQFEILSEHQRKLPKIYLEHDPPRDSPTDTSHVVDDPEILLVHCTHFNNLMWNCNRTPTRVIEHGVCVPEGCRYRGTKERGIVVINGLLQRGRRLGADVFNAVRREVALDLVGMQSEEAGGLGEVPPDDLPRFEAEYRFFFHPIRYTSLGLAVCEAMMIGMPIVGFATAEMATVIENDVSGFTHTDTAFLVERMKELLYDPGLAHSLGLGARRAALERFNIDRFARDWDTALRDVAGLRDVRVAFAAS